MDPALRELIAAGAPGDQVAVIVRLKEGSDPPPLLRLVARFGDIATGRAPRGALAAIHDDARVASLKAPRVYAGEWTQPLWSETGDEPGISEADPDPVDSDIRRPSNLFETGRGAVVCAIDWGIDFAHPDFRHPDGRTRLIALWDQRARGNPQPYGYGRIHDPKEIDQALRRRDPFAALDYSPGNSPAHGSHVLGIAAGNGRAGGPQGVAPEADLIFVHLGPGVGDLGNSIDLLEAIDFSARTAGERPLAINMSIGRHAGPHDGTLLIERAIDWLIVNRPGTVVVQSTGNYFDRGVHMEGRLRETRTASLPFHLPESDDNPVTLELWYKGSDTFHARAFGPDGAVASAGLGDSVALKTRGGRALGMLYHRAFDPNNGDHLIALVLHAHAPAGDWRIALTGLDVVDGRWHAWIERNAACPRCQAKFLPDRSARTTTTGSICNAMRTIAVGAYDRHDGDFPLARFSSAGPTRDGRPKPLLTAPGVKILSVRSRTDATDPPSYVRMSGTSMAAPHVTGTAALMMQAAGRQPIAVLRRTLFAALDPAPGREKRWGYGLLNIAKAVAAARNLHPPPHSLPPGTLEMAAAPLPLLKTGTMAMSEENPDEFGSESEWDGEAAETEAPGRGAALPAGAAPWTKGHNQNIQTTQQRAIAALNDSQLRAAVTAIRSLSGGGGPQLVAMRESTPDDDPAVLIQRATDPFDPAMAVVSWPGRRLSADFRSGDVIVTRSTGGRPRAVMIADPALIDRRDAARAGAAAFAPGRYVAVIGERTAEQLTGPDGLLRGDIFILRADGGTGEAAGEADTGRPVLRQGARGPAVSELQTRLNALHAQRVSAGGTGLNAAPLTVDGGFGDNTRRAVIAFQRIAFPSSAADWDGVVGQRSWDALLAAQNEDENQALRLPTRCPGLPERQVIDNFAFNSSRVEPRHQPQIIGIARCIIESQRSSTPITHLRLIGHTDPVGSDSANLDLGRRRAEAIRDEIRAAILRMTGSATTVTFDIETRGEREPLPDAGASRRVEVVSDFAFNPKKQPPPPASTAAIQFVLDDDGDHRVDGRSPVATALMFGLWEQAYQAGNVRNGAAEADNFVGLERRRFYLRVRDRAATGSTVTARWRTLNAAGGNDDAPASQNVTLTETAAGSKIFVSRALMLVSDDIDARQQTHSGLASGPDAGLRNRGQSNHRLRRAALDGSVAASYTPAGGGAAATITLPIFQRTPTDVRRRLPVRVINYGNHATQPQIDAHFARARLRWAQAGLQIDQGATVNRAIPAGALDADNRYPGALDNAEEVIVLRDLIGAPPNIVTPDDTLTVVFIRMAVNLPPPRVPANAYATVFRRTRSALGDRFFIFIDPDVALGFETLGHELHHVIHNRGDTPVPRQFFTFNTSAPVLRDDPRSYRRIQTLAGTDPDNDRANDAIINWSKRRRTRRFQNAAGDLPNPLDPADATTGNTLTRNF